MELFETERLLIREFEMDDIPHLYAYGKEAIVVQYQNWGPISLAEAEQFYLRIQKARQEELRRSYILGVVLKYSNKLIGDCGYHFIDDTNKATEIGYNLHPTYWGEGYGTELVRGLAKHILQKHQEVSIYAECDSRNVGSRRVLEKNSFELVELRKGDLVQKSILIDTCRYRLNSSWEV